MPCNIIGRKYYVDASSRRWFINLIDAWLIIKEYYSTWYTETPQPYARDTVDKYECCLFDSGGQKATVQVARKAYVTTVSTHMWKKYNSCKKGAHVVTTLPPNPHAVLHMPTNNPQFPSVALTLHEHICSFWLPTFCQLLLVREKANKSLSPLELL